MMLRLGTGLYDRPITIYCMFSLTWTNQISPLYLFITSCYFRTSVKIVQMPFFLHSFVVSYFMYSTMLANLVLHVYT